MTTRGWFALVALALVALSLAGYRSEMQCVGTACGVVFVAPGAVR